MMTVGARLSKTTKLSVLVLLVLPLSARSVTASAGRVAIIVPGDVAKTDTSHVILSRVVGGAAMAPLDVPVIFMSLAVNVVGSIAVLNTTVKLTGLICVGSDCDVD